MAMYRVKQRLGGSLTLHGDDGQIEEAFAMMRALNKMTKTGMPESVRIALRPACCRDASQKSDLINKVAGNRQRTAHVLRTLSLALAYSFSKGICCFAACSMIPIVVSTSSSVI